MKPNNAHRLIVIAADGTEYRWSPRNAWSIGHHDKHGELMEDFISLQRHTEDTALAEIKRLIESNG